MTTREQIARKICSFWYGDNFDLLEPENKERCLRYADEVIKVFENYSQDPVMSNN